jgi:hypothetical protein
MQGANATVVTALDEIMWLFNIRGFPADIDYNPVIMCATVLRGKLSLLCSHCLQTEPAGHLY